MDNSKQDAVLTNGIPMCPHCSKPTKREDRGRFVTASYYPPIYDENGVNTNPDKNIHTKVYKCIECQQVYTIGYYLDRSEWWYE